MILIATLFDKRLKGSRKKERKITVKVIKVMTGCVRTHTTEFHDVKEERDLDAGPKKKRSEKFAPP